MLIVVNERLNVQELTLEYTGYLIPPNVQGGRFVTKKCHLYFNQQQQQQIEIMVSIVKQDNLQCGIIVIFGIFAFSAELFAD